MPIIQEGDPALRAQTGEVFVEEVGGAEVGALLQRLTDELRDASGVGLAAPQLGSALRIARIHDPIELHEAIPPDVLGERERTPVDAYNLINPALDWASDDMRTFFEGCLSISGYMAAVRRHHSVRVSYLDELGHRQIISATGWHARILQHEIDHLHGVLYIDRMIPTSYMTQDEYKARWATATMEEILTEFRPS